MTSGTSNMTRRRRSPEELRSHRWCDFDFLEGTAAIPQPEIF
jgi:hypothetical protein